MHSIYVVWSQQLSIWKNGLGSVPTSISVRMGSSWTATQVRDCFAIRFRHRPAKRKNTHRLWVLEEAHIHLVHSREVLHVGQEDIDFDAIL